MKEFSLENISDLTEIITISQISKITDSYINITYIHINYILIIYP